MLRGRVLRTLILASAPACLARIAAESSLDPSSIAISANDKSVWPRIEAIASSRVDAASRTGSRTETWRLLPGMTPLPFRRSSVPPGGVSRPRLGDEAPVETSSTDGCFGRRTLGAMKGSDFWRDKVPRTPGFR